MTNSAGRPFDRRAFLVGGAALIGTPALAQEGSTEIERDVTSIVRRNISSFRTLAWQDYFSNLTKGAILVDISSRALHYWRDDGTC